MANLKDIRKRIGSVKSTQKITRAMKLVAGARLRKAQENIERLRPYALKTHEVLSGVAARVGGDEEVHPLLARREPKNVMLVVLTADRGLAGAFNSNINKMAYNRWKELETQGSNVSFGIIGRKGRDYFTRRDANIRHDFLGVFEELSVDKAGEIGRYIVDDYSDLDLDACYLVYNEFKSAISQQVVVEPFLPITPLQLAEDQLGDFIYEPSQDALLDRLLPMYVEIEIYRALLESVASEHGARMTAMDAATNNASDMIDRLTLQYNRARQAAITKELMEIIGGAEALKA
ncbi:MAG: ATP synthase F1 subunit gamma [Myxococcales bacterium]|nr:ATP synthase F1 subunit gamma [Myxococcales bacterium]